eukprot:GFYU01007242.1.p1 GENE.GFYU01007242.1~~GFYU01007242.1.p1  ORF type:complete len:215 (-),score=68.44 GFYU01007242.1:282-926(-)
MTDEDPRKFRTYRKSQQTNAMLIQYPLGKCKPTTYDLPSDQFTYGKPNPPPEGAAQVIQMWKAHVPNPQAAPGRDFVGLNKASAKKGAVTAKDTAAFRKDHDIRKRHGYSSKVTGQTLPSDKNPGFTYGCASRPSTAVDKVLNHSFQRNWVTQQETRFERERDHVQDTKKEKIRKSHEMIEKVQAHHHAEQQKAEKPLFKLSRFQNVPSRLNIK